ncbi:MAG TPA: hypothetical protein ENK18_15350 [Deltaproteobacteria bacterium]|nr:hypothetical protein [Deltaproteobacteria bacterium]
MSFRLAVFGDVHGRVALMIALARRWQQETDQLLDGILQVGDMGAFPDPRRLDGATARHARHDPDELGFCDLLSPTELGESLLADDETPPIAFCRGDHEDHEFLSQFRSPTALDPWNKLWFIPDGQRMHWRGPGGSLVVGAFGGAPPRVARHRGHGTRRRPAAPRWSLGPEFSDDEVDLAFPCNTPLDVLLTHAGPAHPALPHGSSALARLARRLRPAVHVFGHHHQALGPIEGRDGLLVGLEHLDLLRDGSLRPGAWGVLHLAPGHARFERIDPPEHAWLLDHSRVRDRAPPHPRARAGAQARAQPPGARPGSL